MGKESRHKGMQVQISGLQFLFVRYMPYLLAFGPW